MKIKGNNGTLMKGQFNEVMRYGFDMLKKDSLKRDYEIPISDDFAGYLIGKQGKKIKELRKITDCDSDIVITKGRSRKLIIKKWSNNWRAVGEIIKEKQKYDIK
jgi:predicted RNA-binding protein YlqC (UPF0109 family)